MKGRIITFIAGVLAGALVCGLVWLYRIQPGDFSHGWPADASRIHCENTPWYRAAILKKAGSFILCTPAGDYNASGVLRPAGAEYPQVIFSDYDGDGRVNEIVLAGGRGRSVYAEVATNGFFSGYSVCLGEMSATSSVSMVDSDFNGEFDVRTGPGHDMAILLESNWYRRIVTNNAAYIDRGGGLVGVICSNGQWRIR